MSSTLQLDKNVFLQQHPLQLLGMNIGRTVSIIRLQSGQLIIHSTARFSDEQKAGILALGEPAWIVEASNLHDTFSEAGAQAFPRSSYLVPEKFPQKSGIRTSCLTDPPREWKGELDVVCINGMPNVNEHIVFHRDSKTLIVADLLFNIPPDADAWTRHCFRLVSGLKCQPGFDRLVRLFIKDRNAFEHSLKRLLTFDFENLIVSHGTPIQGNAKQIFGDAMSKAGFEL